MRTTSEQKQQVREYLLECIDLSGYDQYANLQLSEKERFRAVYDCFKKDYCYPENLRYYGSEQKVFENWLMGLPSCFTVEYRNYAIIELTQKWGFAPSNLSESKEQKILEQWWSRIYMAFIKELKPEPQKPQRKTKDEYVLLADYGQGWEEETTEETKKEIIARLKEYQKNAGQYAYKYKKRRVKI
jgi:hypothetical protein